MENTQERNEVIFEAIKGLIRNGDQHIILVKTKVKETKEDAWVICAVDPKDSTKITPVAEILPSNNASKFEPPEGSVEQKR